MTRRRSVWYFTERMAKQNEDVLSCPTCDELEEQEQLRKELEEQQEEE